jgi:DNA-binding NarL/FixJ family response regulator
MNTLEVDPTHAGSILIVDDNANFLSSAVRILKEAGFEYVETASTIPQTFSQIEILGPQLILIDIHLNDPDGDGIKLTMEIRRQGYRGKIAVLSGDRSSDQFFRAARAGANDFLIKGTKVDLPFEIHRILSEQRGHTDEEYRALAVGELGYLRTFGLTPKEIEILVAYAKDFPLQKILSDRVGKAEAQLRKSFSRIQAKLGVDNLAQLGHILTICAMFERDN